MGKEILISLMTIAMVAAMIGGGVYAAFSDLETSGSNTFTTGTLNLQVGAADQTTEAILVSGAKPADGHLHHCSRLDIDEQWQSVARWMSPLGAP